MDGNELNFDEFKLKFDEMCRRGEKLKLLTSKKNRVLFLLVRVNSIYFHSWRSEEPKNEDECESWSKKNKTGISKEGKFW